MARSSCVAVLLTVLLCSGIAFAQDVSNAELLKMVNELKTQLSKTTSEVQALRKQLQEKDRVIQQRGRELSTLRDETAQKGERVDLIEKRVDSFIAEQEKWVATQARRNEFGVLLGTQTGVYQHPADFLIGGFYDFAIVPQDPLGNRLAGEIMVTFCRQDRNYPITPALSALNVPGLGVLPPVVGFEQKQSIEVDIETLSVILGGKYRVETLGKLKPYAALGMGFYVFAQDLDNDFTIGQVPPARELESRGYPAGNADLEVGLNMGGGIEYQLTDLIGVGFDARYNWTTGGHGTDFATLAGFVSFNF